MSSIVPLNWYSVVLVVSALAAYVLTFPARRVAVAVGYVAQPDERKVHTRVTPEAGGVAMFLAMLVAWAVAASIPALGPLFHGSSEPLGLILGATAIFVVGTIDDLRDMSAPAKVAGEVLAATILYFMGVTWFQFKVPLAGLVQLSPEWTPLLTALWVIAITNAVNLIDGLDGLAAGVVAIASGALAVYGLHLQHIGTLPTDNIGPLIAIITCGICVGFLPHNFHPARIFMGDAGALLLGLLMAASTMLIGGRAVTSGAVNGVAAHTGQTYFFFAPLFIPFFILGVPIVDMAFAFIRRTASRTGFSTPDKNHLHHRLLRLGHGHRRSVLILWAWTVLLSGFILFPLYISSVNAFIPFGALALGVILYTLFHPSLRRQADSVAEADSAEADSAEADVAVGAVEGGRVGAVEGGSGVEGSPRSPVSAPTTNDGEAPRGGDAEPDQGMGDAEQGRGRGVAAPRSRGMATAAGPTAEV